MKLKICSFTFSFAVLMLLAGCGGGSGGSSSSNASTTNNSTSGSSGAPSTTPNTAQLVVDGGPSSLPSNKEDHNLAFTTVMVCAPGTSNCQSIDHIQVDTSATGLRILSSVLTVSLPQSASIAECSEYGDMSFVWGPLATADIKIAGEVASSVPIQVINAGFQSIPQSCSNAGGTNINDVVGLGANGVLGVGILRQDCGSTCVSSAPAAFYYSCSSGNCQPTSQSLAAQVQNPVWMFSTDNNGVVLQLPSISDSGQGGPITGSLIFGIGTQSDNALGSAFKISLSNNSGDFATVYNGVTYTDQSFIDSGSDGYFFLSPSTTGLQNCASGPVGTGFYCTSATQNFSVAVQGESSSGTPTGSTKSVSFNIADAVTLLSTSSVAFDDLGGPGANASQFNYGLPFFFGRTVYTAIEGQNTSSGTGPYFAF